MESSIDTNEEDTSNTIRKTKKTRGGNNMNFGNFGDEMKVVIKWAIIAPIALPILAALLWGTYEEGDIRGVLGISIRRGIGATVNTSKPIGEHLAAPGNDPFKLNTINDSRSRIRSQELPVNQGGN